MKLHPYINYAYALIQVENDLSSQDEIRSDHLINGIEHGLNTFRLRPKSSIEGKEKVSYDYVRELKGAPRIGLFLSPSIITPDKQARHIWNESNKILQTLKNHDLSKTEDIKMSISPMAGEYLSFSSKKSIGRGKPKSTLLVSALSAITTLTTEKPCLQYRVEKKSRPELTNVALIPDLPLNEVEDFIVLFKKMKASRSSSDLFIGNVLISQDEKKKNKKTYEPRRPLLFQGNFPNPPRSSVMGSVALLGAIGEFAKEAEVSALANKVLESLKNATMYMIKYGGASTFTYNHHIVDIAKDGKLRQIVDGIYLTILFNEGRRTTKSTAYQNFDLMVSRLFQLFNRPAFKDFLAFRAEYSMEFYSKKPTFIDILFITYFNKIEMIDIEIIKSAKELGRWLNQVAYFAARGEVQEGSHNYWDEIRKIKAKVLVELESSTFSAKSGDALIAQVITRAGRISGMDAPAGASLFMEKASSGELALDNAKNLLIAFSRLKNKAEQKQQSSDSHIEEIEEHVDLSKE